MIASSATYPGLSEYVQIGCSSPGITVDKVLVGTDGTITFTMVGGTEYKFRV